MSNKRLYDKLHSKYDNALQLTIDHLKNDTRLTRLQRKVKIRDAIRLTDKYFAIDYNNKIDLRGMIEEDLRSRKMREYDKLQQPKCKCPEENKYCFSYNFKQKCWIK